MLLARTGTPRMSTAGGCSWWCSMAATAQHSARCGHVPGTRRAGCRVLEDDTTVPDAAPFLFVCAASNNYSLLVSIYLKVLFCMFDASWVASGDRCPRLEPVVVIPTTPPDPAPQWSPCRSRAPRESRPAPSCSKRRAVLRRRLRARASRRA